MKKKIEGKMEDKRRQRAKHDMQASMIDWKDAVKVHD
jgi:hypothetical protein